VSEIFIVVLSLIEYAVVFIAVLIKETTISDDRLSVVRIFCMEVFEISVRSDIYVRDAVYLISSYINRKVSSIIY